MGPWPLGLPAAPASVGRLVLERPFIGVPGRARRGAGGQRAARGAIVEVAQQEVREPAGGLEVGAVPLEDARAGEALAGQHDLLVDEVARGEVELGVDRVRAIDADGRTG